MRMGLCHGSFPKWDDVMYRSRRKRRQHETFATISKKGWMECQAEIFFTFLNVHFLIRCMNNWAYGEAHEKCLTCRTVQCLFLARLPHPHPLSFAHLHVWVSIARSNWFLDDARIHLCTGSELKIQLLASLICESKNDRMDGWMNPWKLSHRQLYELMDNNNNGYQSVPTEQF